MPDLNTASSEMPASSKLPWPPLIFLTAATVAGGAAFVWPWPIVPTSLRSLEFGIGCVLIAFGIGLLVAAGGRFHEAGTPIPPNRPTKSIVTGGVYGYTRNPMYLGMSLMLAGLGIAFDQVWFLLALPIAVLAVTKLAIDREETYLAAKFGAEYLTYKATVRRWL